MGDAAGRVNPDELDLGAGTIEKMTLKPGLYKWGSSVGFTSSLTFEGTATDVWILQMTGDLIVGAGAIVTLAKGAKAENIFQTGSSLNGRALAQTAVTLDAATIE